MNGSSYGPELSSVEPFLAGELAHVDVTEIEHELKQLWQLAASSGEAAGQPSIVRACSLNLILFSDLSDFSAAKILDDVVTQYPCRMINAKFKLSETRSAEASVSALCHLAGAGMKQICSEKIDIAVSGQATDELASIIVPLILPDIPVYIWWYSSLISTLWLGPFLNCANRLIFDSTTAPFHPKFIVDIEKIAANAKSPLSISDLNWQRILCWRKTFARAFAGFPLSIADLLAIDTINITYCKNDTSIQGLSCQALWLISWLVSRLSWDPHNVALGKRNVTFTFGRAGNQNIKIKLFAQPATGILEGTVLGIDGYVAEKCLLRLTSTHTKELTYMYIYTQLASDNLQEREQLICRDDECSFLGSEFENVEGDAVFDESLIMASKLSKLFIKESRDEDN